MKIIIRFSPKPSGESGGGGEPAFIPFCGRQGYVKRSAACRQVRIQAGNRRWQKKKFNQAKGTNRINGEPVGRRYKALWVGYPPRKPETATPAWQAVGNLTGARSTETKNQ